MNLDAGLARWIADPAEGDAVSTQILDAALEQFQLLGLRRGSIEDVARRARVSRVTIYRRFPRKEALAEAVLLREVRRSLAAIQAEIAPLRSVEQRIERALVLALRQGREHPLIHRLLSVEPEEVLAFLTLKAGPVLAMGSHFIAGMIRESQKAKLIADYDPRPVAELIARLAHSLLLTPKGAVPLDDDRQAAAFARRTVVPLLRNGIR